MSLYELTLGWRYTRAKRRNRFVSFIALMSMLGIALGVAALIVVLSVMNGFQTQLRSAILAATAHVQVRGVEGPIANWQALGDILKKAPDVKAIAPYVEGDALFTFSPSNRPGLLRGIDPATENVVGDIEKFMRVGKLTDLKPGSFSIILGRDLAQLLGVSVGEKVVITIPQGTATPAGTVPRSKAFTVIGLFEIGYQEADSRVAIVNVADAQRLYQMDEAVSGLRVRLHDLMAAPRVAGRWVQSLPAGLAIASWTQQHATLFRAVDIEKRVMFIILALIVAVAAFNLVSTLVMAVTEKQADIAIMRTLGARPKSIMGIFMLQGAIIGIAGTLIGAVLGVLIAQNVDVIVPFIERTFGLVFMDKSVYQIPNVPSELKWDDVKSIVLISLVLSLLATIYPSWRASQTHPAEALRYE
jgi:lipoprotein-releasing system permease protein